MKHWHYLVLKPLCPILRHELKSIMLEKEQSRGMGHLDSDCGFELLARLEGRSPFKFPDHPRLPAPKRIYS